MGKKRDVGERREKGEDEGGKHTERDIQLIKAERERERERERVESENREEMCE